MRRALALALAAAVVRGHHSRRGAASSRLWCHLRADAPVVSHDPASPLPLPPRLHALPAPRYRRRRSGPLALRARCERPRENAFYSPSYLSCLTVVRTSPRVHRNCVDAPHATHGRVFATTASYPPSLSRSSALRCHATFWPRTRRVLRARARLILVNWARCATCPRRHPPRLTHFVTLNRASPLRPCPASHGTAALAGADPVVSGGWRACVTRPLRYRDHTLLPLSASFRLASVTPSRLGRLHSSEARARELLRGTSVARSPCATLRTIRRGHTSRALRFVTGQLSIHSRRLRLALPRAFRPFCDRHDGGSAPARCRYLPTTSPRSRSSLFRRGSPSPRD